MYMDDTKGGPPSNYIRQVELNDDNIWVGMCNGMCKSVDDVLTPSALPPLWE